MRNKSWQSLLFKVRHLTLEIEDREELIRENSAEFERRVLREMGEETRPTADLEFSGPPGVTMVSKPQQSDEPKLSDAIEHDVPVKDKVPPAVKRLWKAIALQSHPDRVGSDGELGRLYRIAASAWADHDFAALVGVALELGLYVEPDDALAKALKEIVVAHERRLADMEQTAVWQWLHAEPSDKPAIIMRTVKIVANRFGNPVHTGNPMSEQEDE